MVESRFVLLAIMAISLLLSGAETREVNAWPPRQSDMCCNQRPEFGPCETKEDDRRCEQMCLSLVGCTAHKGGGCTAISAAPGSVCSCYC